MSAEDVEEARAEPPAPHLLADEPSPLDRDEFGHLTYATVLSEALLQGRQPMTIGLLGPWGVGKSSVLRRVERTIAAAGQGFVLFDAWRYDGETLRRHLFREVAEGLDAQGLVNRRRFDVRRRLEELEHDQQRTVLRTAFSAGGLVVAALQAAIVVACLLLVAQTDAVQELLPALERSGNGIQLTGYLTVAVFLASLAGQVVRAVPTTTTRRRIEDPEQFSKLFTDLIDGVSVERVVIAVDNLDRCSPSDALELLATIKTYLEPAAKHARTRRGRAAVATEVLFVLALDDEVLRAHIARSDIDVDEFLRKLFGATIRMSPLLSDDLGGFARGAVDAARPGLAVGDADARRIEQMIDAGLGNSPRQILQFVNNLQILLRLARERERGERPQLAIRISEQPAMIAKLGLIADRWPGHFRLLQQQPHLLDLWHGWAREQGSKSTGLEEWTSFEIFLRFTDDVRADDLRPFIYSRQPLDELALPESAAFRSALLAGDRRGVGQILDREPGHLAAFGERAERLYEGERRAGNLAAARAVLDVLLVDERLGEAQRMARLLPRVADDPEMGKQLGFLPASSLLATTRCVGGRAQRRFVDDVVDRLSDAHEDRALEAADALAVHGDLLVERDLGRIRQAATTAPLLGRDDVIVRLSAIDEAVVSDVVVDDLVRRLGQFPGVVVDAGLAPAFLRLLGRACEIDARRAARPAMLDAFAKAIVTARSDAAPQQLEDLLVFSGTLPGSPELHPVLEAWVRLADGDDELNGLTSEVVTRKALEMDDWPLLDKLATQVVRMDLARAVEWFEQVGAETDRPFTPLLTGLIITRLEKEGPGRAADAFIALLRTRAEHPGQACADLAVRWMGSGRPLAAVRELLADLDDLPPDEVKRIAGSALARFRESADFGWLELAIAAGARSEATARLRELIAGLDLAQLDELGAGRIAEFAVSVTEEDGHLTLGDLIAPVFTFIGGSDGVGEFVDALIPRQANLRAEQRTLLRSVCLSRAADSDGGAMWDRRLEQLAHVGGPHEADVLARDLLGSWLSDRDPRERVRLMELARRAVRGASPLMDLQLLQLAGSDAPADREVATVLRRNGWSDTSLDVQPELALLQQLAETSRSATSISDAQSQQTLDRLDAGGYVTSEGQTASLSDRGRDVLRGVEVSRTPGSPR